ncbi:MAG: type III restriction-modification system subunit M [Candidatus Desulfovibrio kirbyi]|uniref:site-specific DNA-methyltransferase (adenine-specific) n=1 Tax=Candidatus Desulfovibrio kirbyi TaxID=2696086 RepID=A0A6L2R4M4_9BACT|nr:MAG: type III restriction-modification system subunit M [Candidatus Desulfovibrio kirbyi]
MDKLKMHSPDMTQENITRIRELFPNCVTEAHDEKGEVRFAVDFDLLRQELSDSLVEGQQERYRLDWPGKRQALLTANAPIAKTLRPCREESVDFDTTKNLYIEGDNLDALKLLQESYLGRVKMIYIDPPYNTGNDFIYKDDFSENTDEYFVRSNQKDEEGNRLFANTESNGRFHSDWLSMMYGRLKLARTLLRDDGVIFISIDDNEVAQLRKICEEVFGSGNFVNQIAWVNNITGRQISGLGAAKTYEYILIYAKNISNLSVFTISINFAKSAMPDAYKGFNKDIRTDERGEYAVGDTLYNHNRIFNEETRPNLVFSIYYNPDTGAIEPDNIGVTKQDFVELLPHKNGDGTHKYHAWRWSRQKVVNENYDLIVLPTNSGGYEIYTKIREFNKTILKDIITNISNGDTEFKQLFEGKKCFDYPKSSDLLKTLFGAVSISADSTILDFFSGSATTAHAVMQLNAEDGGNRQFIMVQLPEVCAAGSEAAKAGYENICEIGKERIRRAGKKIKAARPLTTQNLDIGFRVLKVDSSCMEDVYYTPDATSQKQLSLFTDNIKKDRRDKPEDLLFQVLINWGVELHLPITPKTIQGKKVFFVDENSLVACFDSGINDAFIKELVKFQPLRVVFRDGGFASDDARINAEQIFKQLSPETEVKVL